MRDGVGAVVREPRQDVAQKLEGSGSSPFDGHPLLLVVVLDDQQELGEELLHELGPVPLKLRSVGVSLNSKDKE